MRLKEAIRDFAIFRVYQTKRNKKGKKYYEDCEFEKYSDIPEELLNKEGVICISNCSLTIIPEVKLCFIISEEKMNDEGELELI